MSGSGSPGGGGGPPRPHPPHVSHPSHAPPQQHRIAIVRGPPPPQPRRVDPSPVQQQARRPPGTEPFQAARALPPTVRLLSPLIPTMASHPPHQTGVALAHARPSPAVGQGQPSPVAVAKQPNYHVPRGPAAVAGLSVPRPTAAVRAPLPAPGKPIKCWSANAAQPRPGSTVVYAPRASRPHAIQAGAAQRPTALRPAAQQPPTAATVVTRAVRPANAPSPQRTPSPQMLQTVTAVRAAAPKVVPLVQRNYPSAKVVGVALGVRPNLQSRNVGGTYYYEVSNAVGNNTTQSQIAGTPTIVSPMALTTPVPVHSLPVNIVPPHCAITSFANASSNLIVDASRPPTSPQRPSILRKRDNEGSPVKSQWTAAASPPHSPGGSTTVSAASSPELDDEESHLPPAPLPQPPSTSLPFFNNCSPRKKPRKQLLNSEVRVPRSGGDCEFPSETGRSTVAPSPPPRTVVPPPVPAPPEPEKPPRRVTLSAAWTCGWRANAMHFVRPSDVKKREEKRPTVVEIAAQKQVLQKANGWKIHHLTAQMEDLIELETGVLQQATESLRILESYNQPDLNRICELLKGNIQRSKIVCEGVNEAKTNVLRIFQHKPRVSDILARQADKRCFKKQRNQY